MDLQMVVSYWSWMLGNKPESSAGTGIILNCWTISSAPICGWLYVNFIRNDNYKKNEWHVSWIFRKTFPDDYDLLWNMKKKQKPIVSRCLHTTTAKCSESELGRYVDAAKSCGLSHVLEKFHSKMQREKKQDWRIIMHNKLIINEKMKQMSKTKTAPFRSEGSADGAWCHQSCEQNGLI